MGRMYAQTAAAKPDRAAPLVPVDYSSFTNVPWYVVSVLPMEDYRLLVHFVDGTHGIVQMHDMIFSQTAGVFAGLRSLDAFSKVTAVEGDVLWANGLDLAPDAMYEEFKRSGEWVLR